jgi:polysaccharide export outer membrane protein
MKKFNSRQFYVVRVATLFAIIVAMALATSAQTTANKGQPPAEKTAQPAAKPAQSPPSMDQNVAATQQPAIANPFTISPADRYRIGPGDLLDIRILNRPNLSRDNVRVEGNGTIRMPLIEGEIQAACLTESELEKEITQRYLKYYRNPQVGVFIKEYRSTQVAIIGQVNDQSRFLLQRRVRLLELLSFAKGPAEHAGQTINVIHSGTAFQCKKDEAANDEIRTGLASYRLADTLRGDEKANPYLENGDIVTLPEADQVFVVGNVTTPRTILLKDPITLATAIAMAGGVTRDAKKDKVRVLRQEPGSSTKKEIFVDLGAIEKKKAEDIALQANDIVDVTTSTGKSLLHAFIGTIAPTASQLPIRVIP